VRYRYPAGRASRCLITCTHMLLSEVGLLLCCRRLSTMTALDQEIRAFMGRQCFAPEGAMPRRAELVNAGAHPAA
jgi:hypothetical protein